MLQERNKFLQEQDTAGEARHPLNHPTFHHQERHGRQVQPRVPRWERGGASKVPLTLSNAFKLIIILGGLQWRAESLLRKPGLLQRFSHCPWVSAFPVFLDHSQEGLRRVHRLLLVPRPLSRSVCLLPDAQVGETPSGFLPYGSESHNSHRCTFAYGWMSNFSC